MGVRRSMSRWHRAAVPEAPPGRGCRTSQDRGVGWMRLLATCLRLPPSATDWTSSGAWSEGPTCVAQRAQVSLCPARQAGRPVARRVPEQSAVHDGAPARRWRLAALSDQPLASPRRASVGMAARRAGGLVGDPVSLPCGSSTRDEPLFPKTCDLPVGQLYGRVLTLRSHCRVDSRASPIP